MDQPLGRFFMKRYFLAFFFLVSSFFSLSPVGAVETTLPEEMKKIMDQQKYQHSIWGLYVKDFQTGNILFDLNSDKFFSPASTTKLFSIAALLHTFGDDYRFQTPVYANGTLKNGVLDGDLILVAQGDLTLGGRALNPEEIAFTKLDHIYANAVPGAMLTKEDPLFGIQELAKQIKEKGILEIQGNVLVDDRLFETLQNAELVLSPIIINDNLIDLVIHPTSIGEKASIDFRPKVLGYVIQNETKTVEKGKEVDLEISSDPTGHTILVQGMVPIDADDIVRTSLIHDPRSFAEEALIYALQNQGIKINRQEKNSISLPATYKDLLQVALWTSPPISEFGKLTLKVSHNLGANLVPLLLASHSGKKTFIEGMSLLGNFILNDVHLPADSFVLVDAAGGGDNRFTPQAEVKLLEYMQKQPSFRFQDFYRALPILGIDGSLQDVAKKMDAVGKIRAKTGTGISFNLSTGNYFLNTQALSGYIEGKNGHLFAFMLVVNNVTMPRIEDVFPIFEDLGQIASIFYQYTSEKK
jgi:serine-type D-Ala-D-Ala carboxypeptidase/endopeptidase (penicillin-binding protein 4)